MKIKHVYRIVIILIMMLMSLSACESAVIEPVVEEEKGHVLTWNIYYMPRRFYPSMTLSDEEKQVVVNLYEGLTRVVDDTIHLGMAEAIIPSEDFLSYRVELKHAQWSDGRQVTTDDFIYSWERKANYLDEINLLYYDTMIEKVVPIDEHSFEIYLYHANDKLLEQLSTVAFMPVRRDVIDLNKAIPIFISDVTNGPFTLKSYSVSEYFTLAKNIHYYDYSDIKLDEIKITLNTAFEGVYQSYQQGAFDFVLGVSYEAFGNLMQNEEDFKIYNKDSIYAFGINSEHNALKDVRLRQLLNLAIDRSALNPYQEFIKDTTAFSAIDYDLIETYAEEGADPAYYPVMKSYVDIDKVKGIIVALGTGKLEQLNELRLVTRDTPNDIKVAELLVAGWQEYLGINMVIEAKDRYDYAYALKNGDYEIILNHHSQQKENLRYSLKQFLGETTINTTTFDSYTYNTMLLDNYAMENSKLYNIFRKATNELDASVKLMPIFYMQEPVIMSESIRDWSRTYEGMFYFGRAYKTVVDKEVTDDESREVNE